MNKKELIFLDAKLTHVIQEQAFRAELDNGHQLVAWRARECPVECRVGDVVGVQMSPFDMSRGQIILKKDVKAS
jgi:translation initiation factor IF-1